MPRRSRRALRDAPIGTLFGTLIGALAGLAPALPAGAQPRLEELSRLAPSHPDPRFGGFSGLEVSADGLDLTMVSDRGAIVTARITREGDRIAGLADLAIRTLKNTHGRDITRFMQDAEGMAIARTGLFLSFEGNHRIWRYDGPAAVPVWGPDCDAFEGLQLNSGLEALAADEAGTLYAIPERSGQWARPFPVYRMRGGRCDTRLQVPRRGTFLVTGADIGPDGRLYVLERRFVLVGFATRIRAFRISGDALTGEETLIETGLGVLGNMEGIAAWRDAAGDMRLTLIADDNFSAFQQTLLVEYRILPDPPRTAPRPRPRPGPPSEPAARN